MLRKELDSFLNCLRRFVQSPGYRDQQTAKGNPALSRLRVDLDCVPMSRFRFVPSLGYPLKEIAKVAPGFNGIRVEFDRFPNSRLCFPTGFRSFDENTAESSPILCVVRLDSCCFS